MDIPLFVAALVTVYLIPGPDMILVLQTGALHGRRAALATAGGLAAARGLHVLAAAVGLAVVFTAVPWTLRATALAGSAYLVWLGVQVLRSGPVPEESLAEPNSQGAPAWRRGFLTNLSNPKSLLFCSVLLPQFVVPDSRPIAVQFTVLGLVLVAVGLAFDATYATLAARLRRWMHASPTARWVQRWLFGLLLIGFGLRLALT